MRKWSIPTWLVVATGLLLNIISALMTNFFIDGATMDAGQLIQQQSNNDKLISLTWQQIESIERKREVTLSLLTLSQSSQTLLPEPVQNELLRELHAWQEMRFEAVTVEHLPDIMAAMNREQEHLREKINQLYIENLSLGEHYTELMSDISGLRNLALFLQVIGLAMVLARDLSRKQDLPYQ
ncbi:hypothetical protein [Photobacterium galatheae]|uniref:DNA mismatch repair protein n=1 Tax=Photobacterium galatheae TaxID=1654360 RepID=A0A066S0L0_9GAMM|nr:hypothetical protein [Photobacterium galatheae]KDM93492.1 hypothetical protein EA58_01105 [Photobacterium galatheae]MCM0147074.1 hypothetical protein [Photobacterium galatheae]